MREGNQDKSKISIWWDIENCGVPKDVDPHFIAQNLSTALHHANLVGPIEIQVFGDTQILSHITQKALSDTGITLNHVPRGNKDAADKAILVGMLLWALDNSPPAHILLISGDGDFANALHRLRLKKYSILLACPAQFVKPALLGAALKLWNWKDLAKGHLAEPELSPHNEVAQEGSQMHDAGLTGLSSGSFDKFPYKSSSHIKSDKHNQSPISNGFASPQKALSEGKYGRDGRTVSSGMSESRSSKALNLETLNVQGEDKRGSVAGPSGAQVPASVYPSPSQKPLAKGKYAGDGRTASSGNMMDGPLGAPVPAGVCPSPLPVDARQASRYGHTWQNLQPHTNFPPCAPRPSVPLDTVRPSIPPNNSQPSLLPATNGFSTTAGTNLVGPVRPSIPPNPARPGLPPASNGVRPSIPPNTARPGLPPAPNGFSATAGANPVGPVRPSIPPNTARPGLPPAPNGFSSTVGSNSAGPPYFLPQTSNLNEARQLNTLSEFRPVGSSGTNNPAPAGPARAMKMEVPGHDVYLDKVYKAMKTLERDMLAPTESNLLECIQYWDPQHERFDVGQTLSTAVELQQVIKSQSSNRGVVMYFPPDNKGPWSCVDPGNMLHEFPEEVWKEFQSILLNSKNRQKFLHSRSRYDAAFILKNLGSGCIKNLAIGQIMQLIQQAIQRKNWLRRNGSRWSPLSINTKALPEVAHTKHGSSDVGSSTQPAEGWVLSGSQMAGTPSHNSVQRLSDKDIILDKLKILIPKIIKGDNDYYLSMLPKDFQQATGVHLDLQQLGYAKLQELINDISDVAHVEVVKHGGFVLRLTCRDGCRTSPVSSRQSLCTDQLEEDKENDKDVRQGQVVRDLKGWLSQLMTVEKDGYDITKIRQGFLNASGKDLDKEGLGFTRLQCILKQFPDVVQLVNTKAGVWMAYPACQRAVVTSKNSQLAPVSSN